MSKKYTDEFLISELQHFYEEEGFVPAASNMTPKNGYPAAGAYQNHFGSFNNALEIAGLKINKISDRLDGTEICLCCGRHADEILNHITWLYPDGIRYCEKHGRDSAYVKGILDINSPPGRGRAGEICVVKTLKIGDEHDCVLISMGYPFDLYHKEKYKKINVKTSVLSDNSNLWQFSFNAKKIADTYICVGMSSDTKNIEHIWVVPNESEFRDLTGFNVYDTRRSLSNRRPWEVNLKIYDDAWQEMLNNYTDGKCKVFGKKGD